MTSAKPEKNNETWTICIVLGMCCMSGHLDFAWEMSYVIYNVKWNIDFLHESNKYVHIKVANGETTQK